MNAHLALTAPNNQAQTQEFKTNIEEARRFLLCLVQKGDPVVTFQTFCDRRGASTSEKKRLVRVLVGTIDEHFETLSHLNAEGAGIFVTVNKTKGPFRREEDVIAIRATFIDKDNGALPNKLPLLPSLIVESRRGDHGYFLLKPGEDLNRFSPTQKILIGALESDPKIHDLPRVMRLPGFYHMKDPTQPFMVKIKSINDVTYTLDEITKAFGSRKTSDCNRTEKKEAHGDFLGWVNRLSIEEAGKNPLGGRNCTLLQIAREGLAAGLNDDSIYDGMAEYAQRSGETDTDVKDLLSRQRRQHERTPFRPVLFKPGESPADVAEQFLHYHELLLPDGIRLILFWKGEAYRYRAHSGAWHKWDKAEFKSEVLRYLQSHPHTRKRAKGNFTNDVIANIEALTIIPTDTKMPGYLNTASSSDQFVVMKNGILNLSEFLTGKELLLLPHTPEFFSTASLPFVYDAAVSAPTWLKFLNEMIPDPGVQALLQEWFGYNLIFDTTRHKFLLLIGDGANGKTVICVVLRCLLGVENVSAVSLEQFNPIRVFPLTATCGKLANIVEEIGEMSRAEEGMLKNFVSGGQITGERKHKDPFEFYPTARLTFASNVLPRFSDRSDGLWRRMLPIPLVKQILDESKQDKRLVCPEHWARSGELPGIFNWALEGLRHLSRRGHFVLPPVCQEALAQYKQEANPAGQFLDEKIEERPGGFVTSRELYFGYSAWMERRGLKPLGDTQFAREIKRRFPKISLSPNARRIGSERFRVWEGLGWQSNGETDWGITPKGDDY